MRGRHTHGTGWGGHNESMKEERAIYLLIVDILNGKPLQIITPSSGL